ncbi:MAG: DUF2225 domain-containing protein [Defluviitaleaceae bacterium]|nr:DUF2225 domain-containing protein [Defluviitaleaceae bacterium]
MNTELLKTLGKNASTKRFREGHVILRENETTADEMFIILAGRVGVYKNFAQPDEIKLTELNAGEFFGEMSLFLHKERTATVVCLSDFVILLAISRINAYEIFESHPELTYSIIRSLCQRLDESNQHRAGNMNLVKLFTDYNDGETPPVSTPAAEFFLIDPNVNLFPAGHKTYDFAIPAAPSVAVSKKKHKCPLCMHSFAAYAMRGTHVNSVVGQGKDFRVTHEGIDAIHYDVVTCPNCYFSTLEGFFKEPIASRFYVNADKIKEYKSKVNMCFNMEREINNIFAGYYLALKCAPLFYAKSESLCANLWLRLMWLYRDCGDKTLERLANEKAYALYLTVFENTNMKPAAAQQTCVMIGELALRVNDVPTAKAYFTRAKTFRQGNQALIGMAEEGLRTIRNTSRY